MGSERAAVQGCRGLRGRGAGGSGGGAVRRTLASPTPSSRKDVRLACVMRSVAAAVLLSNLSRAGLHVSRGHENTCCACGQLRFFQRFSPLRLVFRWGVRLWKSHPCPSCIYGKSRPRIPRNGACSGHTFSEHTKPPPWRGDAARAG